MSRFLSRRPLMAVVLGIVVGMTSVSCKPSETPDFWPRSSNAPVPFDPQTLSKPPLPKIEGPLRFTLTPYLSGDDQDRLLGGMVTYLEKALATTIRGTTPRSYDEALFALENEAIDFGMVTPTLFVKQQDEFPTLYEPVASTIATGSLVYESYIVVRRDSPIEKLSDLKGKRVAFPHRLSTSGYVYPHAFLLDRGLDIRRDMTLLEYGGHSTALNALMKGESDAAFVASDTLVIMRVLAIGGPVRILAKAGRIPFDAIVVRASLPEDVKAAIRHAVLTLSLHTPEGRDALFEKSRLNGFIPIPPHHYDEVRTAWKRSQ